MVVLRCKCLNVNLHLSRAPAPISPDSEVHVWISEQTNIKKVGEAELGMGGSKSEYEKLISHRYIHGWKLTRCCNCNADLYLISLTNPTLALVNMELDDQSTPIQGSNMNTNTSSQNTNSPNSSPASSTRKFSTPATANTSTSTNTPTPPSQLFHYSPTFRMFLLKSGNEDNELLIPPSDSDPTSIPTFNKLQKQIDDFLAEEERLMDRRIKAFIKEQNEHFKEVQAAAYTDRKLLWNKICTINAGTGNTAQTSSTASTPTSTISTLTPTSTPKGKDWTSARVKLQGSSESLSSTSISQNRLSTDYQSNTPNDSNSNNNNINNNNNNNNNNDHTNNNNTNTTSTQNVDSTTSSADPTPTTETQTTPTPTATSFIPKQNGSAKMPNGHTSDEPDAMFSFDEEDEIKNEGDDHTTARNVEEEKEEVEPPPLSKHRLVGATQQGSSSSYLVLSAPQLLGTSVPVSIPGGKIPSIQRFSRESRRGSRTSQNEDAFDMDFQAALQKGVARTYVVPRQSWATTILEPSDIQPEMAQSFRVPLSLNYRRTNRTGE